MKKPDLGSIKPTCGQCDHWRLLEGDDGECCAMPAHAIIADDDDGRACLTFIRPSVQADERACIHFRGKN